MRFLLSFLFFVFITLAAMAQKWLPGHFYDTKGNKVTGLIHLNPSGKGPIRGEGFIEFKEDNKEASTIKLSASDIRSFVIARDSFVVAATDRWSDQMLDFVRVALDAPLKLYSAFGAGSNGGGGGFSPQISGGIGTGIGGGSYYGGGLGGGISIPIGGSGRSASKSIYFFGTNTADMKPISNQGFIDIMSEVMGDEPEVVEQIRAKKFSLNNIEKLIAYYKAVEDAHRQ